MLNTKMFSSWVLVVFFTYSYIPFMYLCFFFFFFLWESFNLWHPLLIIHLYHQTKSPISFWCRQGLNSRSLIQPSKTLPVDLNGTHLLCVYLILKYCHFLTKKPKLYIEIGLAVRQLVGIDLIWFILLFAIFKFWYMILEFISNVKSKEA